MNTFNRIYLVICSVITMHEIQIKDWFWASLFGITALCYVFLIKDK